MDGFLIFQFVRLVVFFLTLFYCMEKGNSLLLFGLLSIEGGVTIVVDLFIPATTPGRIADIADIVLFLVYLVIFFDFWRRHRETKLKDLIGAKTKALRDKLVSSARHLGDRIRVPLPARPRPA